MADIEKYSEHTFEQYKHVNEYGEDFWFARDLQVVLQYKEWRNFIKVIEKAKSACKTSGNSVSDHFVDVNKMVHLGSGSQREVEDIMLSRYACYLIVQNGDPKKEVVALGQTYFAVQTRKQELQEEFESLDEDKKRLAIRNELKEHNKSLQEAAMLAGVETNLDYATFQNHGYRGLYGGLDAKAIHARKGLKKSHKILDYMGSTELAANLFRATQTDEKLRRDNVQGKQEANKVHYEVGSKVRKTIEELGGTMPEDLPTPEKSIKHIEKQERKKIE
ncbi:DNA damage-inducible protein D [Sporosarcina highlanderae]|uniref:DNA damage-inducible protein D n=1 Tax=Sporosarcina highlanderae TaxID=3035916 RepID=A0ABT8JSU3_9BACL|nr:DNA damage-inducible protein D [Sporosarcina highlanderae]MDN4608215.1 DNA damage-inducible protein D [Sporosarcina highlanderae]